MRYPFAPVDAHRGSMSLVAIAEHIGKPFKTVEGWRRIGIDEVNADAVAIAIGHTVHDLWPDLIPRRICEQCPNELTGRADQRFCSNRCRGRSPKRRERTNARRRERWATDPEWRQAVMERRRKDYWTVSRDVEVAKQRARDRARAS